MTWSLQLPSWALPSLLAVLVVLRDLVYLWPRQRETAAPALVALTACAGAWAFLDLASALSPSLQVKVLVERWAYVPAAAAPVAWAWFALEYAGRGRAVSRWPMALLCAVSAGAAGVALASGTWHWLLREVHLVEVGRVAGLHVTYGVAHWLFLAARLTALAGAATVLWGHLSRTPAPRRRALSATVASVLALAPVVVFLAVAPAAEWGDVSSAGFALGASLLRWQLLRPRLLGLGPVDRALVLDELEDPIVVLDGRGRVVDVNRAAERDLGIERYGDVPVPLGTLWATGRKPEAPSEKVDLQVAGGDVRAFEVTLTPLEEQGASRRAALVLRDITERTRIERDLIRTRDDLTRANADLERLARTDALTGLANRRHFMEALGAEIERADRYRRRLALVLLDLDHFKGINDGHGHAAGDEVLRQVARALRSVCRDVDLAARLGGEEFALLLPETEAGGARTVAERARHGIQATVHRSPAGDAFQVTASFGVSRLGPDVTDAETLLQAADKALYQAKQEGRNRVVLAE